MMAVTTHGFKLFYNQGKPYLIFSVPVWEDNSGVYIRRAYDIDMKLSIATIRFKGKSYMVSFYK